MDIIFYVCPFNGMLVLWFGISNNEFTNDLCFQSRLCYGNKNLRLIQFRFSKSIQIEEKIIIVVRITYSSFKNVEKEVLNKTQNRV